MLDLHPGTGSSNPFPSSEESCKPSVPQRRLLGEGGHAFLADATDPEAAVFGEHVDRQLVRPVFVLAERVGDVAFHPWLGSPNASASRVRKQSAPRHFRRIQILPGGDTG